jgi:hypothetical protein
MIRGEPFVNSEWFPLERMLGSALCNDFMYMGTSWPIIHKGTEQKLFLYKHVDTRHYLNLSLDGTCFRFTATGYVPIALDEAIEHVFS